MTKPLPLWSRNFEASANIIPEVGSALSAMAGIALTFEHEMNDFIRKSVCVPTGGIGAEYQHSFGGALGNPVVPPGGKVPCHLLYMIDSADPLFPIRIDGTRLLPLIYCQQYNAAAMSYRVEGDSIIIDWIESLDWDRDFPYDDYPSAFPRRSIVLQPADLDVLGREEDADGDGGTNVSRFGGWHWLCQGIPTEECRNPTCDGGDMDVFGVIYNEPVEGVKSLSDLDDFEQNVLEFRSRSACWRGFEWIQ